MPSCEVVTTSSPSKARSRATQADRSGARGPRRRRSRRSSAFRARGSKPPATRRACRASSSAFCLVLDLGDERDLGDGRAGSDVERALAREQRQHVLLERDAEHVLRPCPSWRRPPDRSRLRCRGTLENAVSRSLNADVGERVGRDLLGQRRPSRTPRAIGFSPANAARPSRRAESDSTSNASRRRAAAPPGRSASSGGFSRATRPRRLAQLERR